MNSITKELKLSETLVPIITKIQEELKALQEQYKVKSEYLGTIISALCLQENIDLTKQALELSADYTILFIKELPVKEEVTAPVNNSKKKK